jgi:plastocyanin
MRGVAPGRDHEEVRVRRSGRPDSNPTPWTRRAAILAFSTAAFLGLVACGEDDESLPAAEAEVLVRSDSYLPETIEIEAGQRVRWVHAERRGPDSGRTVTSGEGPNDPQAGALFDALLEGYASDERFGDTFVFRFEEPDSVSYFSRIPAGREFRGRVIVR